MTRRGTSIIRIDSPSRRLLSARGRENAVHIYFLYSGPFFILFSKEGLHGLVRFLFNVIIDSQARGNTNFRVGFLLRKKGEKCAVEAEREREGGGIETFLGSPAGSYKSHSQIIQRVPTKKEERRRRKKKTYRRQKQSVWYSSAALVIWHPHVRRSKVVKRIIFLFFPFLLKEGKYDFYYGPIRFYGLMTVYIVGAAACAEETLEFRGYCSKFVSGLLLLPRPSFRNEKHSARPRKTSGHRT